MTLLKLSRLQGAKLIGAKKTMIATIYRSDIFRSGIILFINRFCAKRHGINLLRGGSEHLLLPCYLTALAMD